MYSNLDLFIIIVCAVMLIGGYIILKASGEMWWGINWSYIFRGIRKCIRRLFK